jgi:hypothetical protein
MYDVVHICERKNEDGTYDRIFIGDLGSYKTIRISNKVTESIVNSKDHPAIGVEFLEAYIETTNDFQQLSDSLFSEIDRNPEPREEEPVKNNYHALG